MSEEAKKISFGFSKLAKSKTCIISNNKPVKSDESVQFIDCVEGNSIKVKNELPKKPEYLVIPMPKQTISDKRRELLQKILSGAGDSENSEEKSNDVNVSTTILNNTNKIETLDEVAAREIVEDLKKVKETQDDKLNFTVPLTDDKALEGKESTQDDYDSIPVEKFGVAMLRGMGWAPGKGIGKTEQVISAKQPVLRPKGLGLGADKVLKKDEKSATDSDLLKLVKGSFVRIVAGAHKDLFGEVIGFDDETGRLIVKMALGNNVLTFNEFMVEVISKNDFNKNSKVINVKKYEEYKSMENAKGVITKESSLKESEDDKRLNYKTKHKRKRTSSGASSDSSECKMPKKYSGTKGRRSTSTEQNMRKDSVRRERRPSPEKSPIGRSSKHKISYEHSRKNKVYNSSRSSSPEQKHSGKHHNSRKNKTHRSSSEESTRSTSRSQKHISRKESKKTEKYSSSSDSASSERQPKSKKLKIKNKKRSNSSGSSDEKRKSKSVSHSDYKKKCKKNKEKKSRRRSRSYSGERRKSDKSSKKHKKSKYYD